MFKPDEKLLQQINEFKKKYDDKCIEYDLIYSDYRNIKEKQEIKDNIEKELKMKEEKIRKEKEENEERQLLIEISNFVNQINNEEGIQNISESSDKIFTHKHQYSSYKKYNLIPPKISSSPIIVKFLIPQFIKAIKLNEEKINYCKSKIAYYVKQFTKLPGVYDVKCEITKLRVEIHYHISIFI